MPTYPYCYGYRRREEETSCEVQLEVLQSKLDTLRYNVSDSCHSFIGDRNTRTAECLSKTEYGEIVGARVWNVAYNFQGKGYYNATVMQERLPVSGYSFCKSVSFNIESINDPCVKKATMSLVGPPGSDFKLRRTENRIPYTIVGDINKKIIPMTLSYPGDYMFSITPDKNIMRTKTWNLTISDC